MSSQCVLLYIYPGYHVVCLYHCSPHPQPHLSSALSSRLASSLSDLYVDVEEDRKTPYSSPSPSSPSVSLFSSPTSLAPASLCRYGNGTRSMQHEVNNNSGSYWGSAAPSTGKSFVRPGPKDFSPYRGPGPYSAMKGPSGRYLSRSIPVSPLTQQQLGHAPLYSLVFSVLTSLTHWIEQQTPVL